MAARRADLALPSRACIYTPAHAPARCTVLSRPRTASNSSTRPPVRPPHTLVMSRALALAALLLLAALAAADSSAESIPFAREVAGGSGRPERRRDRRHRVQGGRHGRAASATAGRHRARGPRPVQRHQGRPAPARR
ncbi:hypothetical protein ZWY2020_057669 [Hordeum vulgare]|nr:hypothetical protein ZWY2020_057669 [Hordeum vulgare]